MFTWKCRPSSHKNSRPRMATLTCSGNAVAFYAAFLPTTTRRALCGGGYSSVLIWSETFPNSGSVFLSRRSSVSGRCSRMAKAASSIRSALLIVSTPTGGASWEGFVIEAPIAAAPSATRPHFYQTQASLEVDLVLEFTPDRRCAIEIKMSSAPTIWKGLRDRIRRPCRRAWDHRT